MMKAIFSVLGIMLACIVSAQSQHVLAPDQNPEYMQSQNKYIKIKDSIIARENTTAQQTYKAYDWYVEKVERRNQRREFRREIRLANACNYSNYYNDYGFGYGNGFNSFQNYGYRNNWCNFLPSLGYSTGNWRFWY